MRGENIMKKITLISKDITQKQWSNLVLEMNLIKKSWSPYAKIELQKTQNINIYGIN